MKKSLEESLSAYGLIATPIIMDGVIHRCGTHAKPRSKNGWYIVYDGGIAASYGDWQAMGGAQYWSDGTTTLNYDRSAIERLREQREEEQLSLADEAVNYIESLPREGYSEYLKTKKISPHGVRFDGNALIIPLQDADGKIWSYQKIYGNGDKYFMSGGRTSGCYFFIAKSNVAKDDQVIICEGYATGCSIHMVTGLPVIIAFNAGNLKKVADSVPFRNLTVAADNDANQVGQKAAKDSGYDYVMPDRENTDFNDLFCANEDIGSYFTKEIAVEDSPLHVHGLVGDIAKWITDNAIRPQPFLSVGAALAFVGMLKGHVVSGTTDLRTNLLVMAFAPTGGGKDHPHKSLDKLARAVGRKLMGEPVSGGGFLKGLDRSGRVGLLAMDEVGRYIGNLTAKNSGSHQREIIDYIIKTFSCANSTLYGRQYVDDKKNPTIDIVNPHFCCYGSTVPEKFRQAVGSSEVIDGFLNRWLVFHGEKRSKRNERVVKSVVPDEIIHTINERFPGATYSMQQEPEIKTVPFTRDGFTAFKDYRTKMDAMIETSGYPLDSLYSRSVEHVEKIALTLCDDAFINLQDVECAIRIVELSNKYVAQFAVGISDTQDETDFLKVQDIIKGAKEIKHNDLRRKCQFLRGGTKRLEEIISVLKDDVITTRQERKTTYYKWIQKR